MGRPEQDRVKALLLGTGSFVALGTLYLVAVHTAPGIRVDGEIYSLVFNTFPPWFRKPLGTLARSVAPVLLILIAAILTVTALVRRRWREVAAALLIPAVSTFVAYRLRTTWLPVAPGGFHSFPSTHAAAGLAALVSCWLLWPRPHPATPGPAVLGTAGLLALGNVTWYAHRPSDVLGSILLVVSVSALTVALTGIRPGAAGSAHR